MQQPSSAPTAATVAYLRLILVAALLGIPAALAAAAVLALVHYVEGWLWQDLPRALGDHSPPWFLVIGLPVAGAAVTALARWLLPGDGGHPPLGGLSAEPTEVNCVPGVLLAAVATLGFGAVLGPEMPVIAVGSATGMAVSRVAHLGKRPTRLLSSAGSFSAISALFGGPLVAGIFLTESGLGLGANLAMVLLPGFVAAAVGYLIFTGFGHWGGLNTPGLSVPHLPAYTGTHLGDLVIAVVTGCAAAVIVTAAHGLGGAVDKLRGRLGMPLLLVCGGLAVGLIAQGAAALGADSQEVLFSGQSSVPAIVEQGSAGIIALVLVAKFLAYGVSLGAGYRGGPVFPAIFLGTGLASLAVAWFGMSPTAAVAVGAAAGMTAQTRLLVTPVLFAALLVGAAGTDATPAAVLATAAAWLTLKALDARTAGEQDQARDPAPGDVPAQGSS